MIRKDSYSRVEVLVIESFEMQKIVYNLFFQKIFYEGKERVNQKFRDGKYVKK